jgi:UDP-N-acetyl-2-amino-2-deoxyglucuronate dehydrogenase
MLSWIFGPVKQNVVHVHDSQKAGGFLELEKARVRWFLSLDRNDLPFESEANKPMTYRSISVDSKEIEFSGGFTDLHTESYKRILAGQGFGMEEVVPSLEIVSHIRNAEVVGIKGECHSFLTSGNKDG